MPVLDDLNQLWIPLWKIEGSPPVIARPHRDGTHGNLCGWKALLSEDPVDDLVVGAVTPNRDDIFITFFGDGISD